MNEMRAVAELAGLDRQNGAALGQLPIHGGRLGYAEEGPDGRLHAQVRIAPDALVWDPSIIVMPHAGDLELELVNDDQNTHCALLPSNGDQQFLWLPNNSRGYGQPQPRLARAATGSVRSSATMKATD